MSRSNDKAGLIGKFNSGDNTFTMPTTRGDDNHVLTRDNSVGTGGTTWKQTIVAPAISSITYPTESGVVATALEASGGTDDNVMALTITTAGTGYSGSGTLSATGGAGNGFAGTYTESGGAIATVTITDPGQEYTSTPTIVVSGSTSGTAAVITASLNETLLINGTDLGTASAIPTVQIEVGDPPSYVAFAGTVSCNAEGTVVTCANVTKRASGDNQNLKVTHGSNGQAVTTTVNFSADPSFTTASGSLGTVLTGSAMTAKTITAGTSVSWYEGATTMPTWMTHFVDGDTGTSKDLTGTPTNTGTSEVQNFNIIIRDSENQSHNRDFSLTVVDYPTGGTIIEPSSYSGGGYRSHSFLYAGNSTSTNTFSLYAATTVDVLLVGGGGGSFPYDRSGGGGAGAFVPLSSQSWPAGTYTMTVGEGGANSSTPDGGATKITYSGSGSFTQLWAKGGAGGVGSGDGRNSSDETGKYGGSGGGLGTTSGTLGSGGTYGNNGSNYSGGTGNGVNGGGGGGAGGHAVNATGSVGGIGGAGDTNYWRDGASGTTAGFHVFAGGGGGGAYTNTGGTGGKVGTTVLGGDGGKQGQASVRGVDGTGSGGGGGGSSNLIPLPRGGGHGVIILRYATT